MDNTSDLNQGMSDEEYVKSVFPEAFQRGASPTTTPGVADSTTTAPDAHPATAAHAATPEYHPATGTKSDQDLANEDWGTYLKESAQNLPGSLKKQASNIGSALYNYDKTIPALIGLGTGAISKGAGYLGVEQDPQKKAEAEAGVDALVEDYTKRYKGILSGDTSGLSRTFHDDPASVGMDVATLAPGIGIAGRAVGMGEKAAIAAKAASLLDPIQASLAAAKQVSKVPGAIVRGTLAKTSGVDSTILKTIQNAGRYGTKEQLQAMQRHASKAADPMEMVDAAVNGVNRIKNDVSDEFVKDLGSLSTDQLDVTPALKAIDDARAHIGTYVDPGTGVVQPLSPSDSAILDQMESMIRGTGDTSAINLHKVKVAASNLLNGARGSPYLGSLGKVPAAIREAIGAVEANKPYLKAMDDYSNWLRELDDLKSIGAAGNRGATANKIAKLMKAMKDKRGKSLIDKIASTPEGANLPFMLAGSAMSNWLPKWATGMQDMLGYGLIGGTGYGLATMLSPHALAGVAAASPKVVGTGMKYVGKAQRLGDKVAPLTRAPVANALVQAGAVGMPPPLEGVQQAAGGRVGRKAGGRVGNPGDAAERLILAAERAKKSQGNATSALLQMPDEAITKALAVANEHI